MYHSLLKSSALQDLKAINQSSFNDTYNHYHRHHHLAYLRNQVDLPPPHLLHPPDPLPDLGLDQHHRDEPHSQPDLSFPEHNSEINPRVNKQEKCVSHNIQVLVSSYLKGAEHHIIFSPKMHAKDSTTVEVFRSFWTNFQKGNLTLFDTTQ